MTESLQALLRRRDNDHRGITGRFEVENSHPWHTAGALPTRPNVSVVIPAHNVEYCLPAVLDALSAQTTAAEVVVVDDASTDGTAEIARRHTAVDQLIRLPGHLGSAAARNVGAVAASGSTIVFLDADMVLPPHVIADLAARAHEGAVLIGFRHGIDHGAEPPDTPDVHADHRVRWRPPVGRPLLYSGIVLDEPVDGRPLDHTHDLLDLGFGRTYYDWDLPRMVVTALLAVPRHALFEVGGFAPEFGALGWGMEDTHLGAKLIAAGLLVIPVRQAVGFHLNPPDAAALWQAKLASWPATLRHYRSLLAAPPPRRSALFAAETLRLLSRCEVNR
ncbi:glycosyltransferase [Spongiactinospora sp. TRM90649]|uniref:glycosyltransferase family 2 protein n=1 Tax=Spongiactinospora sp. TRM90649 TaxID=3031114 RepID=UPI0023F70E86|nr:glycosyltransferase [Spongiactinospora sp. TRM90649]MDF5759035.1 glycosyltransferase [Spongiactinospora sp. TRM90649]